MRSLLLSVMMVCMFPCLLRAAVDTIPVSRKIEALGDMVTLKLTQSSDLETIGVTTPGLAISLSPNAESATRLGFSYRFISFGIRFVPRFLNGNNDDALKGKTSSKGFSLGFNFRHWMQNLSWNRTRGYYLENTKDFLPGWTADSPYIQFPDLVLTQYEGSTAYNFNPDFSVNASITQSERQLKSAGSFIPVLYYKYNINENKTVPEPGAPVQKGRNFEVLLGAGYHYNFVWKQKFYLALGLTPAAGYTFTRLTSRYETYRTSENERHFMFRLDARAGIGYNSKRFFTGIYMRSAGSAYREQESNVTVEKGQGVFHLVVGFRLNAPSWIKKPIETITDKIGIK
ncbi:MAG: DUF4421 domain-containing protein [Pseudobacter sp.]|uniref:DUF4421 domain-containing protein n=1 Tax=Pseudobacter sp. TaxID=2045420 RepID=UPI003F7FCFE6